jgi:hypothetical protein
MGGQASAGTDTTLFLFWLSAQTGLGKRRRQQGRVVLRRSASASAVRRGTKRWMPSRTPESSKANGATRSNGATGDKPKPKAECNNSAYHNGVSERQPTMCIRCRKGRGLSMFEGERDQHDLGHREERRPSREHQGIERAVALCQDIGRLQTRTLPRPRVGSGEHSQSGHRPTANTAIPTNAINTRWLSTKASWRAEPGRLLLP